MAKEKLLQFKIAAMISQSKDIIDFLQKSAIVHFTDCKNFELTKYDTSDYVDMLVSKEFTVRKAMEILEKYGDIKENLANKIIQAKEITYGQYVDFCGKVDEHYGKILKIIELNDSLIKISKRLEKAESLKASLKLWEKLDIRLASKRTLSTRIFIGSFDKTFTENEILDAISQIEPEIDGVAVEVISSDNYYTNAVLIAHINSADALERALKRLNFISVTYLPASTPSNAIKDIDDEIFEIKAEAEKIKSDISHFSDDYENFEFLSDFLNIQIEKYKAVELAATTENIFFLSGYVAENRSEELKFELESKYASYVELCEAYGDNDAPVLIKKGDFSSGVSDITAIASPISNRDIDPNLITAFFYYCFLGLMVADGGYGIVMVLVAVLFKVKLKLKTHAEKTANMLLFSGLFSTFFGALFGRWFGNMIPTIYTEFFNFTSVPELALWFNPLENISKIFVICLIFGVLHLFTGLIINIYKHIKNKKYLLAFTDCLPKVPLILFKALSYSRLFAIGITAAAVSDLTNLLSSMTHSLLLFLLVSIIGHTLNLFMCLSMAYVHGSRLQLIEFFPLFYEGEGKSFSPFKIFSNHFRIKEDN